jgi:hypothetical protein
MLFFLKNTLGFLNPALVFIRDAGFYLSGFGRIRVNRYKLVKLLFSTETQNGRKKAIFSIFSH